MRRLIPDLPVLDGSYSSAGNRDLLLYLQVLEQTPYTSRFLLTWRFSRRASPEAELRAYHDARQLEIQRLEGLVLERDLGLSTLQRRWQESIFLSKWLGYCCAQGYDFSVRTPDPVSAVAVTLAE